MALPFGRWLGLGKTGHDVKAVKRALARAGFGPGRLAGLTPVFGPFTRIFLKRFEKSRGLPVNGVYGPADHASLTPYFDSIARNLYLSVHPTAAYVNPFGSAHGLVPERTDQGVDFGAAAGAPILAMGRGTITRSTTTSGWVPNDPSPDAHGCVQYVLTGPGGHKGEEVYIAEYLTPIVKVGQTVEAGQVVARFNRNASTRVGIETGWVKRGTHEPCSGDTSGTPTEGGIRFTRWLRSLGCPTQQDFGAGPETCPC